MLELKHVYKQYPVHGGMRTVLDNINLRVEPGHKLGILGRNGSGKSTLVRLIGGAEQPDAGSVYRGMRVSWPLALSGGFQGSLTGIDNLRFICRIYGETVEDKIPFVQDFSSLGSYLREPVKTYSSGMRARLAFAISMVIDFDCYLIDEITAVGDDRFRKRCQTELFEKRADRAMVLVSHVPDFIRAHCDSAGVMKGGKFYAFDEVDEALEFYRGDFE
jgi:capsular polysaccharide transport system ATP-binding protein